MLYSSHLKSLMASYLFILLPFSILILVKLIDKKWLDIILASDWSIASFIIFGQSLTSLSSALVANSGNKKREGWEWYVAKLFITGIAPSMVLYIYMLKQPSTFLGILQILMFVYASYRYFIDGLASKRLA
ncbi:TPA: hypothetical protein PCH61_002077 [Klebsiella pneumoniae]|uniref:hypothetical protein n=1 Tax=Klebsiella TaxID=570 RepID=UPI00115A7241|nr:MULTISPECIES: hypothetical protein [Klebsiella]MCS5818397.1 hypothetical protein [Klebsiella pneumoniae subsp. pneumoniae]HBR1356263.1 hypothetical protein [Klebsiella quasipneumoniae subsp. quasipneumoniae]MBD7728407.1 hypothetical protein [Klebsiella pneumoniae]MCB8470492.1 hypothetical protein [Klebsiella pneumoniae]MCW9472904.1 hypothetical protein [Klebsiella grimontii]